MTIEDDDAVTDDVGMLVDDVEDVVGAAVVEVVVVDVVGVVVVGVVVVGVVVGFTVEVLTSYAECIRQ